MVEKSIVLYTTHCPKCAVLEKKLDSQHIIYDVVDDVSVMEQKGFDAVPMLEVDGEVMDFSTAVNWLKENVE